MTNNVSLLNAALAGALGGSQERWLKNPIPSDYATSVNGAAALATAIDQAIAPIAGGPTEFDVQAIESITNGVTANRPIVSALVTDYTELGLAVSALFQQARIGVVSPVFGSSALTSIPFASLSSTVGTRGQLICVRENLGIYQWLDSQTLAPNGAQVVNAPGGQWQRMSLNPSLQWLNQATWQIDPVNGSDIASGGVGAPLKTWAEWQARTEGGLLVSPITTVSVVSSLSEVLRWQGYVGSNGNLANGLVVDFSGATTVASGTVTSFTAITLSSNVNAAFGDTGANFTSANLGQRIRLTSGANTGAVAWISLINSTTSVEILGDFIQPDGTTGAAANPAPGDTYVIETLAACLGVNVSILNQGLGASPSTLFTLRNADVSGASSSNSGVYIEPSRGTARLNGCKLGGSSVVAPVYGQAWASLFTCSIVNTTIVGGGSLASTCSFGGGYADPVSISGNFVARCANGIAVNTLVTVSGSLSSFGSASRGINLSSNAPSRLSLTNSSFLRGSGNTGAGINLPAGCTCKYPGSNVPTLTGTAGDVESVGVFNTWAAAIALGILPTTAAGVIGT